MCTGVAIAALNASSPATPSPIGQESSSVWIATLEIWVGTLLYGAYCVLFARATQILLRRIQIFERQAPLFLAIAVLFLLSTAQTFVLTVKAAVVTNGLPPMPLAPVNAASLLVYVSSCLCSDALLIYRCLVIWDSKYLVVTPSVVLLICSTFFGYMQHLRTFQILSLTTAISVTLLTLGRVIWAGYRRRALLDTALRRRYVGAGAAILESGAVYAVSVSIHFAFFTARSRAGPVVFAAVAQIVGIAPTLIVVRAGLPPAPGVAPVSRVDLRSLPPKRSTSTVESGGLATPV
ncbi:Zn(2)-C6 fungal-type domain-containing protein [Mycena indigotica]|uniref:Zn(2)-C6 fungal-type domain-containing protein n=1 Tax=Mycena indigotica TaxID=2126181 RepID=A0A8H6SRQ7_9AGAR|nr:Zn(2)-C6 fungal-type domain-containing protein [Mycena indigotica]KAF7303998.1 Zn(2)-C6 fungal-type domain-containing protein [Mycena indigotica]